MTYRPNIPVQIATATQAGVIKPDGVTLTVGLDATASVVGASVAALTDISSGALGGPATSDIDSLNRAGTDYKVTLSARAALFRKTPAGSRTAALANGSTNAVLTSTDNDKQVVVTGTVGTLSADGTISDGFSCFVINKTGSALTYSGISGLGGATTLTSNSAARVYMAASTIEAVTLSAPAGLAPATVTALGTIKPDGTSVATASDGTLSVITTTTHALPLGNMINSADEIATYSVASSSDVKYSLSQIAAYSCSNIQSWSTSARPAIGSSQFGIGYNSTLGRFDFWNGSAWNQHVRLTDLSATPSQLFGGSGTAGLASAVNVGSGLQLISGTLSTIPATVPVTTIATSGSSQNLLFLSSGSRAYDITLSTNCSFTVSGGNAGELQTLTLVIRGGPGGFSVSLPSNVKWKGGTAPAVDTSAGSIYLLRLQTSDGGATLIGNF